jgi:hypothetical protein
VLVVFQFPLADVRPFDNDTDLRLPFPDWPNPDTDINPQFIHHFGKVVERRNAADPALPDEIKFCLARRAIRFDDLGTAANQKYICIEKGCNFEFKVVDVKPIAPSRQVSVYVKGTRLYRDDLDRIIVLIMMRSWM